MKTKWFVFANDETGKWDIFDASGWVSAFESESIAVEFVRAVNSHDELVKALKNSEERINQLCGMVNRFFELLGLGNKVHAEDWSYVATKALAKAEGSSTGKGE